MRPNSTHVGIYRYTSCRYVGNLRNLQTRDSPDLFQFPSFLLLHCDKCRAYLIRLYALLGTSTDEEEDNKLIALLSLVVLMLV